MSNKCSVLIPHLARLAARTDPASDAELLLRFASARDGAAFEALVRRHGAMVLGVCLRVLGRSGDADDAFQNTFVLLVRRAGAVRGESVGGWLYRVARREAVRAAKRRSARVRREHAAARPEGHTPTDAERAEWWALLDREVERLPARYREAFVLCHLEGRPHDEAARELGCPLGTLHSRLARAKEQLRERLGAIPAVAVAVSAGQVRAAVSAASAAVFNHGAWSVMAMIRTKTLVAVAAVVGVLGGGAVALDGPVATPVPAARGVDPLDELRRENERLRRENERLRREVAELKERLAKFEGVTPIVGNPPTDQEVLRALPRREGAGAVPIETFRDKFTIVKNKLSDRLDPPREFPLVGRARLRHQHWECAVYYVETVRVEKPFPFEIKKARVQVVYIDKDALIVE